ncbi:MAG: protein phosphatase CheZ [Proteobacteria bacterium]|nr:protein phosphatase CheZ [Pseudomonadota bacterium]
MTRRAERSLPASSAVAHAAPRAPAATATAAGKSEIETVVRQVVASLRGDLNATDLSLYDELEGLARFIQSARSEIAALRPDEIRHKHLPSATDELDAIVVHTAEATGAILDAAEQIEAATATLPAENGRAIQERVTRIYEACNFQDITGQRITKIVKTLKQIENKVEALVAAFGDEVARERARGKESAVPAATPSDADLLNGPQLPTTANSQADIDALFDKL